MRVDRQMLWLSPFGLANHDAAEKTTMKRKPMSRLQPFAILE